MSQDTTDYTRMGIRWETEAVSKVFGPNHSDKRTVNPAAQIAVIEDLDLFRAEFGDDYILGMSDGTSTRVLCQRVGRKFDGKDVEGNRRAVLDAMRGVRAKGRPAPRRPMPDGTFWHGTDEMEYRQAYIALLVDAGTPANVATALGNRLPW